MSSAPSDSCTGRQPVSHHDTDIFSDYPIRWRPPRILIVKRESLPDCLEVTAEIAEGEIMGLAHKELPVWGVQFPRIPSH